MCLVNCYSVLIDRQTDLLRSSKDATVQIKESDHQIECRDTEGFYSVP